MDVADSRPVVRVEDAALVLDGGPARLALSGLPRASEIADAVAAARGVSRFVGDRLVVTAVPDRLVDAAGRVGGTALADIVRAAVEPAVAAWRAPPPDLDTPGGRLPTGSRPVIAGVLNVTPDSFSDGGAHYEPASHPGPALDAGAALLAEGADLVDVGGESSRPGSEPIDAEQELARVLPVIDGLARQGAIVSVDTTKASVARAAVEAGAALVNDVSAGTFDPELVGTVAELEVPYVLMHMQGTPRTMQDEPRYDDVVGEVYDQLARHLTDLVEGGIRVERIVVDPGIGFGKTVEHNLALLRRTRELTSLGRPVAIGTSRKGFIGTVTGVDDPRDRLEGSLASVALAVGAGARILRVHDVTATVRAVRVAHAIAGR